MDAFLRNMLIHHIHMQHSKCHSNIGSCLSQKLCPNLIPMCSLFARVKAKKRVIGNKNHGANKHVIGNKNHANWKDS